MPLPCGSVVIRWVCPGSPHKRASPRNSLPRRRLLALHCVSHNQNAFQDFMLHAAPVTRRQRQVIDFRRVLLSAVLQSDDGVHVVVMSTTMPPYSYGPRTCRRSAAATGYLSFLRQTCGVPDGNGGLRAGPLRDLCQALQQLSRCRMCIASRFSRHGTRTRASTLRGNRSTVLRSTLDEHLSLFNVVNSLLFRSASVVERWRLFACLYMTPKTQETGFRVALTPVADRQYTCVKAV